MSLPRPELIKCETAGPCALACVAMSCTFLGNKKTLDDVYKINGNVDWIKSWDAFGTPCDTSNSLTLANALDKYHNDPSKYAPPIVKVRQKEGAGDPYDHWVLVCGIKSDGTYDAIDPIPLNPPYKTWYNIRQFYKK